MSKYNQIQESAVDMAVKKIKNTRCTMQNAYDWLYEAYLKDMENGYCPILELMHQRGRDGFSLIYIEEQVLDDVYKNFYERGNKFIQRKSKSGQEIIDDLYEKLQSNRMQQREFRETANNEAEQKINTLQAENAELKKKLETIQKESENIKAEYETKIRKFEQQEPIIKKTWEDQYQKLYNEKVSQIDSKLEAHEKELLDQAEKRASNRYEELLSGNLSKYIEEVRDGWRDSHRELSELHGNVATKISQSKMDACNESSRMQREMKAYMDEYMVQFSSQMDKWRNSLYKVQLEDFARWYTRFCGFVDGFDSRLASNPDSAEFDAVAKIGTSLTSLRGSLERVLPSLGIRAFYPKKGDSYDPVYHEADDYFTEGGLKVKECLKPGVETVSVNDELSRVLVKAEVNVEVMKNASDE